MRGEHVTSVRTAAMSSFGEVGGRCGLGDSGGSGEVRTCAGGEIGCAGLCGDGVLGCRARCVGGNVAACDAGGKTLSLERGVENADNIVNAPETLSLAELLM